MHRWIKVSWNDAEHVDQWFSACCINVDYSISNCKHVQRPCCAPCAIDSACAASTRHGSLCYSYKCMTCLIVFLYMCERVCIRTHTYGLMCAHTHWCRIDAAHSWVSCSGDRRHGTLWIICSGMPRRRGTLWGSGSGGAASTRHTLSHLLRGAASTRHTLSYLLRGCRVDAAHFGSCHIDPLYLL